VVIHKEKLITLALFFFCVGSCEVISVKTAAERVLNRYARLNIGDTVERGMLRIHRWADSIELWDLTNAGKRGKKVERLHISPTYYVDDRKGLLDRLGIMLEGYSNFNRAYATVMDYAQKYDTDLNIESRAERGVDVTPAGFKPLSIKTDNVLIEAGYDSFRIKNLNDQYNEPTCIPASKGGKRSIPVFYRWVKDNESKLKRMTYHEILREMGRLGIKYHDYCAMD
jgi:hypothetical protein